MFFVEDIDCIGFSYFTMSYDINIILINNLIIEIKL